MQSKRNNPTEYKDEHYHEKIVSNKHFIHDIEIYNPLSVKYVKYWREIKRRCMEGYWYEGKWMPGNLYFYINMSKIELSKSHSAKSRVMARPFLRDLEWEKGYVFAEARGFSGFELDDEYTCFKDFDKVLDLAKKLGEPVQTGELTLFEGFELPPSVFNKKGKLKKYENVRKYLRKIHSSNLGKPLYHSNASNVIDFECRRSGKSWWAGNGIIASNFLLDGCYDYDEYWTALQNKSPIKSTTLVGAIDSYYSKMLLDKTLLCFDTLNGSQTFQGKFIPSPLYKAFSGSINSGKQMITASVEKEIGGKWQKVGSDSKIIHKTFRDNPLAGNGAAAGVACFEEVGFFENLIDTLNAIKDTTYNGTRKFGTIYMFGTGGDGETGKIDQAKEVFYNPSTYDCLCFDDIFEETGDIGFFVPYEKGLNQFKDEEGNTNLVEARKFINNKREVYRKAKNNKALLAEMQNNPQTPSEAFLIESANIFPTMELKEQLRWVQSKQEDNFIRGMYGTLMWDIQDDKEIGVKFIPDTTGLLRPTGYKMKSDDDKTGCVHIWELPYKENGAVPHNLYIAGNDPFDQDQSTTTSLGSTIIYKTFYHTEGIYHWPVAEYTARPERIHDHHENVRKLLTLYNAKCLYENERNSLKMHFEHYGSLHLLAKTPDILKANEGSSVNRVYGQHMTAQVKDEIEIYTRNWLSEEAGNGKLNLNKIYSIPLLEELIAYNRTGNFDRVIAFMLVILHKLMNFHKRAEPPVTVNEIDDFFKRGNSGKFY